jgi:hypothetical protein
MELVSIEGYSQRDSDKALKVQTRPAKWSIITTAVFCNTSLILLHDH